jgi:hypothetical protein
MSDAIILEYQLTKDLWRLFFEVHYSCDHYLKMRYLWGASCIIIGSLGFGGFYESRVLALLLLATGFFGVLSKQFLIIKSLRGACRHPFFGKELKVAITPQEISVRSGDAGYSQPWSNFVGYRHLGPGFLLYHDRHSFFFVPDSVLSLNCSGRVIQILEAAKVRQL